MHTYCSCNSINLLLGFPLLCARVICKAITHSKLLHLCYYWNTPSSLPLPPSSLSTQAQCPNHLFPRHKSFPLLARNARIPPSIGKEIFKCNQRIFLCFIFFPRKLISLRYSMYSSALPWSNIIIQYWSGHSLRRLNIFFSFTADTDDTCLVSSSISNWILCFIYIVLNLAVRNVCMDILSLPPMVWMHNHWQLWLP